MATQHAIEYAKEQVHKVNPQDGKRYYVYYAGNDFDYNFKNLIIDEDDYDVADKVALPAGVWAIYIGANNWSINDCEFVQGAARSIADQHYDKNTDWTNNNVKFSWDMNEGDLVMIHASL